jgi:hypothetical protein
MHFPIVFAADADGATANVPTPTVAAASAVTANARAYAYLQNPRAVSVPEPSAWVNDTTTEAGLTLSRPAGGVVEKAEPCGAFAVIGTVTSWNVVVVFPTGANQWKVTWLSFTCTQSTVVLDPMGQATVKVGPGWASATP